jgi:hypothetical protein
VTQQVTLNLLRLNAATYVSLLSWQGVICGTMLDLVGESFTHMQSKKMGNQIARLLPDTQTAVNQLVSATEIRSTSDGEDGTLPASIRTIDVGSAARRIGRSLLSAINAARRWCARLAPITPTVEEAVR